MSTIPFHLEEIDSLEVLVIVDNELDPISRYTPTVIAYGNLGQVGMASPHVPENRGDGTRELRMDQVCCGAHGLSLMITATKDGRKSTILFDTGPEEDVWERNVKRLKPDLSSIDTIVLSHWHRDHSGGMLRAIRMINDAKRLANMSDPVLVDVHSARPDYRGFQSLQCIVSLEADPSFEEIETAGAKLMKGDETHSALGNLLLVSGEIPRVTSYELGLRRGLRFLKAEKKWIKDTLVRDERFVMCHLKDRGLVAFSGCAHAGIVNTALHAISIANETVALYAVMGGFHLADAEAPQIEQTALDLQSCGVKVLLPGHCKGWRFKQQAEKIMPGSLAPSTTGTKIKFV